MCLALNAFDGKDCLTAFQDGFNAIGLGAIDNQNTARTEVIASRGHETQGLGLGQLRSSGSITKGKLEGRHRRGIRNSSQHRPLEEVRHAVVVKVVAGLPIRPGGVERETSTRLNPREVTRQRVAPVGIDEVEPEVQVPLRVIGRHPGQDVTLPVEPPGNRVAGLVEEGAKLVEVSTM